MNTAFNYRHLYYFWVVAKEGSMSNAAARLDMGQALTLEAELQRTLGHAHDFAEGVAAFQQKRAPQFSDR